MSTNASLHLSELGVQAVSPLLILRGACLSCTSQLLYTAERHLQLLNLAAGTCHCLLLSKQLALGIGQ